MKARTSRKVRVLKAMLLGAVLSVFLAVPALATVSTQEDTKTAVTPYFNDLKGLAVDMIPLALAVIAIAVGFRLAVGWFRRSKG